MNSLPCSRRKCVAQSLSNSIYCAAHAHPSKFADAAAVATQRASDAKKLGEVPPDSCRWPPCAPWSATFPLKCSVCEHPLWAPQSQALGKCSRCATIAPSTEET